MEILFLANRPSKGTQASTVSEYLNSFAKYSKYKVHEISMLHHFPSQIDLDRFDIVVTHYSLSLGSMIHHYLGNDLIKKLKKFKGLKVAFLQDEYRETKVYWKNLNALGINILFSCVPDKEILKVYPAHKLPHLRVVNILTGYVPEGLLNRRILPVHKRPIDVGYRTRKTPYWLGRLGYEKWFICEEFKRRAFRSGLVLDLSSKEGERLYGESWVSFISSCRAIIGVESGASIIDYDGTLELRVESYIAKHPMTTFDEIFDLFLRPYEGSLHLNQISPRCFEAAALRTPMILFEGEYSGILKPNRHFIPLKKDFSNFEEVLIKLKDNPGLQKMANRTYKEVALNPKYSYKVFVNKFDQILLEELGNVKYHRRIRPYSQSEFKWALRLSISYNIQRYVTLSLQRIFLSGSVSRNLVFGFWDSLPSYLKKTFRPLARVISR